MNSPYPRPETAGRHRTRAAWFGAVVFLAWVAIILLTRALTPHPLSQPARSETVARSPDGALEVVVASRSSLAGSLREFAVYLQPAARPNLRRPVGKFAADHRSHGSSSVSLTWATNRSLRFRLPWRPTDWPDRVRVGSETVQIDVFVRPPDPAP